MFCPKCSQQQISENVRFCSGCGFQLNVVKALLASDDESFSKSSESVVTSRLRRRKDMITGAVLMLIFSLHSAWTTEDLSLEREYSSLIFKCFILCVLINLVPLFRDLLSGKAIQDSPSAPRILSAFVTNFKKRNQPPVLSAANCSSSVDYFTERINTAELVPPPSVTEDTTNLLRNNL